MYVVCNNERFDPDDPFKESVNYALRDVVSNMASHGYDYYSSSPRPDAKAYAHGACNGAISNTDCMRRMRERRFLEVGGYLCLQMGRPAPGS